MIGGACMSLVWLKSVSEADEWISGGKMFQRMDAATGSERRPTVARRYVGTCSRCDEDEHRRRRPGRSATWTSWSMYGRDRPFSAQNAQKCHGLYDCKTVWLHTIARHQWSQMVKCSCTKFACCVEHVRACVWSAQSSAERPAALCRHGHWCRFSWTLLIWWSCHAGVSICVRVFVVS